MEVKVFIFLAVATGARRGELLGLQWSDVNFTFNQIEIHQAVYYRPASGIYIDTPKNKTSQRFIRLPSEIMELLKEYKAEWDKFRNECGTAFPQNVSIMDGSGKQKDFTADFLFFQSKNIGYPHAPDTANKWLKVICDKNGLEHVNPHSLRHSAASALIFGGVDPASVAKYFRTHQSADHRKGLCSCVGGKPRPQFKYNQRIYVQKQTRSAKVGQGRCWIK